MTDDKRMILLEIIWAMMQCNEEECQMEKMNVSTIPRWFFGGRCGISRLRSRPILFAAFLALIYACPSSRSAPLYDVSDTEPVDVDQNQEVHDSIFIETSMLLDYGAVPSAKFFASRKPAQNVELLWDGSAKLLVEKREEESQLAQYREMSTSVLERHIAMYPRDAPALMVYGVRLYQTNQLEQSLLVFERARQIDPAIERISELYSGVLVRSGNYKRAATRIRELLDAHPDNRVIRFNSACAHSLNNNREDCIYHLKVLAQTGWIDLAYYMGDPDLENARNSQEFGIIHDLMLQEARSQLNRLLLSSMYTPDL